MSLPYSLIGVRIVGMRESTVKALLSQTAFPHSRLATVVPLVITSGTFRWIHKVNARTRLWADLSSPLSNVSGKFHPNLAIYPTRRMEDIDGVVPAR